MRGAEMRAEREHNARAWLAWHIEALHRAKRLPRLERLKVRSRQRRGQQSWQQQLVVMASWAARVDRAIALRESAKEKTNGGG